MCFNILRNCLAIMNAMPYYSFRAYKLFAIERYANKSQVNLKLNITHNDKIAREGTFYL